ncbi:MAG: mannose-1-phosphate guanylyltransferase [Patescibacteria group bacterium]
MKIVILAGGGGTRLWPVSRKAKPKQIQPFVGNLTLLQKTFQRAKRGFRTADIFVSTSYVQQPLIQRQIPGLPRANYILEPAKRDTAAAIGLAAVTVAKRDPHAVMMLASSDHFIKNEKEYIRVVRLAERLIRSNPEYSLLIGIKPTYPETGYGYIKINKIFKQVANDEIFFVQKFIEKPDLQTAKKYVKQWDYLWNSGIFCWRVDYLLQLFKTHLPKHYEILMRIQPALGTKKESAVVKREFPKISPISIDYGIMEKTKKILVIPASFDWADVGHWRTVRDILAKDPRENVTRGEHVAHDSHGNLLYSYSGKLIATAGLHDTIVIETEDCLLVCPKDRAQDVKKLVEELVRRKMKKYL